MIRLPKRYICFAASAALVALMLASGLPVRGHPLHSDRFVVPDAAVSDGQFVELMSRNDFRFLATVVFLVSPTGSNQTYTSDVTWNNNLNTVECVGGGAGGGAGVGSGNLSVGGDGGSYACIGTVTSGVAVLAANFTFATPGTTTATYQIGAAVSGATRSSDGITSPPVGKDTWFNAASAAAASVCAHGGLSATANIGATVYVGGTSSTLVAAGGAAGPHGDGNGGVSSSTGGDADAGFGGAGGTSGPPAVAAGTGTEWASNRGSGGGGGPAAVGGNFGGGGGQSHKNSGQTATAGGGAQGIIILTWTPLGGARSFGFIIG